MVDPGSGYGEKEEKCYGDLAIKIVEHFLPLFVGTYSAAPYRFEFQDFHPERLLGFLPHELDYTHLRMIWRRWKRKAANKFFGHAMTPFGPEWLDRTVARLLGFKGDYVSDFRLLDYLVALLAFKYILQGRYTHQSIPDSPTVESERRQFFFGAAIGCPHFTSTNGAPTG
jgi:hypothetical protein